LYNQRLYDPNEDEEDQRADSPSWIDRKSVLKDYSKVYDEKVNPIDVPVVS
jgi:hypothetical protein